jgi:hypothetical protein
MDSYLEGEFADGAEGESDGGIQTVEELMVEADVLELEVATEEVD